MTALMEKGNFFLEYFSNIKNSCSEDEFKIFSTNCKTDLDRVKHVHKLKCVQENKLDLSRKFVGKDKTLSMNLKNKGNENFQKKMWTEALIFYNKSMFAMPAGNDRDMSIVLANRSAALFYMENYEKCLEDISRALKLDYPPENMYKLYERQARCFLAQKDYKNAMDSFKNTITALDNSKQPLEKRSKIERDSLVMIKMLEKEPNLNKKSRKSDVDKTEKEKYFLSQSVAFDYDPEQGRYAKAGKDIGVGDEIVVEKPNAFALLEKYSKTHCQSCFTRTTTPLTCPKCSDIIFCSEKCRDVALESYHKFECGILPIIWRSGVSINCHMALRIVSSKTVKYFVSIKDDIFAEMAKDENKLSQDDYRKICYLVRHEDKRSENSFFQYSIMAHFLSSCLRETGYFDDSPSTEDFELIMAVVLRNLQLLQYNAHEIFELHQSRAGAAIKTVFIGAGIYPTMALFNHSCEPGIVKYFRGTMMHVNAIKPIKSGNIIAENYGPMYTQDGREDRQRKLRELYQFDCSCEPCIQNWPRFEDMDNSIIRFRCDAEEKCDNILEIPADCNDFMIKCVACGQFTNILKGLKVMQDTELIKKTAKRLYESGDIMKALEKYIDLLKIMNEVLAPPFSDYCECQQNIKDCFLHFGNCYNISQ